MADKNYDIIVIGSGSAGLSVGLFMGKLGFKVLMVSKSDHDIGGDCLNDGCVPSKSFIHVAKIARAARAAEDFGLSLNGNIDIKKVINYVHERQDDIRAHENASWIRKQGVDMALGNASFSGKNSIIVNGKSYHGKKMVIATGSRPRKLTIPGVEKVKYYDNESIFNMDKLPGKLLVVGGGPIGIEIAQAMQGLGSKVTVVHHGKMILEHDDPTLAAIVLEQLEKEGIVFHLNSNVDHFPSSGKASVINKDKSEAGISFDAVFVGVGRELNIEELKPEKAGIDIKDEEIVLNKYLRTSNKNIYVCGDMVGDLQFSHSAEFHARILLNNFFSPIKKKLDNRHMSWVTFTDPELATFGYSEKQLKEKSIDFIRLEQDFAEDDRAVTDNYQYAKTILFISKKRFLQKQKILGGSMVAPNAGELIQELILANTESLSIDAIFNKVYPYPVASRINQKVILQYRSRGLKEGIIRLLRLAYKVMS